MDQTTTNSPQPTTAAATAAVAAPPAAAVAGNPGESKLASPALPKVAKIAIGDKVHLVHHWNGHIEGTITGLHGGGFADLDSVDPRTGLSFVVNRSPRDDSGKQSDSWHPIEREG